MAAHKTSGGHRPWCGLARLHARLTGWGRSSLRKTAAPGAPSLPPMCGWHGAHRLAVAHARHASTAAAQRRRDHATGVGTGRKHGTKVPQLTAGNAPPGQSGDTACAKRRAACVLCGSESAGAAETTQNIQAVAASSRASAEFLLGEVSRRQSSPRCTVWGRRRAVDGARGRGELAYQQFQPACACMKMVRRSGNLARGRCFTHPDTLHLPPV